MIVEKLTRKQFVDSLSNRYTLPIWTQFKVFHDTSEHRVSIDIDGDTIFTKTFAPGIKHHIKLDDNYDFRSSSVKRITINWQGESETANKYLMFDKWSINNQLVASWKAIYVPDENDYITNIKQNGTDQEKQELRKKILFCGHRFGWFGKIVWDFLIGDRINLQTKRDIDKKQLLAAIRWTPIFLEQKEARERDQLNKKN
jgi:hypothetical protein|tara:strand:- start:2130 stop:2729 length:600 start_codon:yes stop_codon:yes gene_type:complete